MASRTLKLYGKVYGDSDNPATMVASWNNQEIYSGPVPTTSDVVNPRLTWDEMEQIATWEIDTSESGPVPLEITVGNGTMLFHTFHANYFGNILDGNVIVTPTVDNYQDLTGPSTIESDGYDNVQIGGESKERSPQDESEALGKWNYIVPPGSTFSCIVQVLPSRGIFE